MPNDHVFKKGRQVPLYVLYVAFLKLIPVLPFVHVQLASWSVRTASMLWPTARRATALSRFTAHAASSSRRSAIPIRARTEERARATTLACLTAPVPKTSEENDARSVLYRTVKNVLRLMVSADDVSRDTS